MLKKIHFLNFFVRIFGQKCLFLLLFGVFPAISRRYGQFVVIHMSFDKFCLRKNGANSGRTPKMPFFALVRNCHKRPKSGKMGPTAAPRPAVQWGQHKNVVFLLSGHDGNKKSWTLLVKKWIFGHKTAFST